MLVKRMGSPTKWEVHDSRTLEYYLDLDDPQYVLEEIVGLPASLARINMRLARAQGPTMVTDGVVLIPPKGVSL